MIWRFIAWLLTRERITNWVIDRALDTPYTHICSADGTKMYMGRWWLFNPYPSERNGETETRSWWRQWLPSARIHCIMRPDQDRHLHDHPWNARTIVLRGWYDEERLADMATRPATARYWHEKDEWVEGFTRERGYTGRLLFGEYHRITDVSPDGVWTLFITWRKRGTWGFLVDGKKVPWRQYLGLEPYNPVPQPDPERRK